MRHQPLLRKDLLTALVKVVKELLIEANRADIHITSKTLQSGQVVLVPCDKEATAASASGQEGSSSSGKLPIADKKHETGARDAMTRVETWTQFSEERYQALKRANEQTYV